MSRGPRAKPSGLRPRRPLPTCARLIAARPGMRRSPFQRLAAPIAVASRPAPARLASPVAWSPFAPPFARGVRPDGTGSASRPVLSTLAAAGSQSPVWRGMYRASRAPQPRGAHVAQRIAEQRCIYTDSPFAACPFNRNVFGNSPSPQSLNDPKSLSKTGIAGKIGIRK